MNLQNKIVLSTLPNEGQAIQWQTPEYFLPQTSKYIPLGLLSLATNASKDDEVKILDPASRGWSIDETVEKIQNENPDIVGLSAVTFKAYPLKEMLRKLDVPFKVVGGPHTTHYADIILNQGADIVFRGILADLEFKQISNLKETGLDKCIIDCKTRINDIEFPKRENIDNTFYYATGNMFKSNNRMSMFTGTGCPHHCSFCDVQVKIPTRKEPKKVIEEMKYLKSLGAGELHLYEDNFNTNKKYLEEICREFDKQNFSIEWCGRAQARLDYDIAKKLKEHGLKRLGVGIESLHNPTLRYFNKPQTYKSIEKFMNTMNKAEIEVIGYFIIGAPTETKEYRKNMCDMIYNLGITKPLINILQPFPDTKLYNNMLKEGIYKEDYWADYIKNPTPNFKLPFPFGEEKWNGDAQLVNESIKYFENKRK